MGLSKIDDIKKQIAALTKEVEELEKNPPDIWYHLQPAMDPVLGGAILIGESGNIGELIFRKPKEGIHPKAHYGAPNIINWIPWNKYQESPAFSIAEGETLVLLMKGDKLMSEHEWGTEVPEYFTIIKPPKRIEY